MRKRRSRIDDTVWRDTIDLPQSRKGKAQQGRKEIGGRRSGRPWNENGPNRRRKRRKNGGEREGKKDIKIQFLLHRECCVP